MDADGDEKLGAVDGPPRQSNVAFPISWFIFRFEPRTRIIALRIGQYYRSMKANLHHIPKTTSHQVRVSVRTEIVLRLHHVPQVPTSAPILRRQITGILSLLHRGGRALLMFIGAQGLP